MLVFASTIAPAARSFAMTCASRAGTAPFIAMKPPVVCTPAVFTRSFATIGMPCNRLRGPVAARSRSSSRAIASASGFTVISEFNAGPVLVVGGDAIQVELHEPFGRQSAGVHRGLNVGDRRRREAELARLCGARG